VGVGALIVDNNRIALIQRAREPSKGTWSIPGGLVRVGEPLKKAVVREALEETGLVVKPLGLVELVERIFPDAQGRIQYHYVLADYLCTVTDGALTPGSDAAEAVWANPSELEDYALPPITIRVIHKALESRLY
jgi:8-oxo-dGTP diphosphatase